MSDIEYLELGILEFEKDLEDDCNNEWLKRVVAGMKKCYQRLETIDNAEPSEALESLKEMGKYELKGCLVEDLIFYDTIKQALLKSQQQEKENEKMKKLLLKLSDISPDNVDCIYQCKCIVNTILETNVSTEINKSCEDNLKFMTKE